MVELQHYIELEDLLHMAAKIKWHLKKNGSTCQWGNSGFFLAQRSNYKRDGAASSKSNTMKSKVEPLKASRKDSTTE